MNEFVPDKHRNGMVRRLLLLPARGSGAVQGAPAADMLKVDYESGLRRSSGRI
jgi:hypothetical protein